MNEFNVLLGAATNGTPSGSLFDALFARYIAPQESWRELESPLPITILAAGKDLIDYRIYGNTVQTGTPTPENPIMPSGCGERTENLFDRNTITPKSLIDDTTGKVKNHPYYDTTAVMEIENDFIITFVKNVSSNTLSLRVGFYDAQNNFISSYHNANASSPLKVTIPTGTKKVRVSYSNGVYTGFTYPDYLFIGLTAPTTYIPYGYKLPLTSASQDVDIYLGESQTMRRIKKLVLTGDEAGWTTTYWANAFAYVNVISTTLPQPVSDVGICSHFKHRSGQSLSSGEFNVRFIPATNRIIIGFDKSGFATIDDFKSYLAAQYAAGTPVTVWYVLEEPETGIMNEPLMKIGDYTDTVSMEQAGVSIPTTAGETIIDYDGTLKPSQMYIKYKS